MKFLLIYIICFTFLSSIYSYADFTYNIDPHDEQCLSEYFSDNLLVIIDLTSTLNNVTFTIVDPKKKVLKSEV